MIIPVKTSGGSYDIVLSRGAINNAREYFKLDRRVLIVTDSGVPHQYVECIKEQCKYCTVFTFPMGEASKNFDTYKEILSCLCEGGFTRSDCVVAVGGGVVGDMAGFAAATFMRGIDFYNVPTTLLSQLDSSIGGKTAIDFGGFKNIVGAFYQPKAVIIDSNTLKTLDARQVSNGMAEALKMALTHDKELFEIINCDTESLDEIIRRSLLIKRSVVESDEKETGLRKVLNFGHTAGHAIESAVSPELLHGECVGLGMLYFVSEDIKLQLIEVLNKLNLPTSHNVAPEKIIEASAHDKKKSGSRISVVRVEEIGKFIIEEIDFEGFEKIIEGGKAL